MKVLKNHSKACIKTGDDNHYIFERQLPYFGNKSGKRTERANWHYWMKFRCNEPKCRFLGVMDDFDLTKFVSEVKE